MARIAFIGLGHMGGGMAPNLAKAGHEVRAFDLVPEAIEKAVQAGCSGAASAAEAVKDADVVITMLPASKHVRLVYHDDVAPNAKSGSLLIDCSTIDVQSTLEVGDGLKELGFEFVDADMRWHPPCLDMQFCDPAVVVVEDRHKIFREVVLILARKLPHDAEVQRNETRLAAALGISIDPDIARMRICVEKVVTEHLAIEHAHTLGGQCLAIDASGIECRDVIAGNTVHAFEREHAIGAVRPDHLWHV